MTPNSSPARSGPPPAKAPDPPGAAVADCGGAGAPARQTGAAEQIGESLYNLAWYPALPVALLLSGGRAAAARRQRLGRVDSLPHCASARRIWLHASSVGEIEALRPVALGLLEREPATVMIVTTMTEAGREAALRRIPGAAACCLAPLDHPRTVQAFLTAAAPGLTLIAEAELWPNYFIQSRRFGARVALVNGRLSPRSLKRYRLLRPLWAAALNCADLLLVQSRSDADRYLALGAPPARLIVTGNTKLAPADGADAPANPALAQFAGAHQSLIAGSTAMGEEEQVLNAYVELRREFPGLRLVLAPRHLERVDEVMRLLANQQLEYVLASALKAGEPPCATADVLLLDTMGDLRLLYRYGTLAFVGGSLFEGRGGQNLAEPAAAGVAVLFGPFHQNQQETARALLAHGGGTVVASGQELARAAARLLRDEALRREQGAAARKVHDSLTGGAARSLSALSALIDSR
jgi:3-deoxy-D-manno-octulosonic-acid transferase